MRRPSPPREIPPPLELECLKALWSIGEGNVRDVRQALSGNRDLAYTTVMTVLDRLVRRGNVARRKVGRSFAYAPILTRDAVRRLALRELIDSFFNASENELLAYLTSAEPEPDEIRRPATEDTLDTTLL
jgi:predicted transcriptional regulator